MAKMTTQFCIECRKETEYKIQKEHLLHEIKGKSYDFEILVARCKECHEKVNLPGLMDINSKLIDEQYRQFENLVSIEDINSLMEVYNIGKAPLSLALGFGEITITRYLQGQYPSFEYSSIIRKAISNPKYMLDLLERNKEKVGETAYKKAFTAASGLKKLVESLSDKMLITISYIFEKAEDITPLALQKLLYYVQAIFMANYEKPLFIEECEAWAHGPVYNKVYNIFKEFKYNPIDDKRFIIFKGRFNSLSKEEKDIIDMVINTFGVYSGKTLEALTHKESPWADVFSDSDIYDYANETITKDSIRSYFNTVALTYNLATEEGLKEYIQNQLAC